MPEQVNNEIDFYQIDRHQEQHGVRVSKCLLLSSCNRNVVFECSAEV